MESNNDNNNDKKKLRWWKSCASKSRTAPLRKQKGEIHGKYIIYLYINYIFVEGNRISPYIPTPTLVCDNAHDMEPFCCRWIFNLLVGVFENTATAAVQIGVATDFQSDTERKAFPRDWDALGTKNMAVGCWRAPQSCLMMDMYLGGAASWNEFDSYAP